MRTVIASLIVGSLTLYPSCNALAEEKKPETLNSQVLKKKDDTEQNVINKIKPAPTQKGKANIGDISVTKQMDKSSP